MSKRVSKKSKKRSDSVKLSSNTPLISSEQLRNDIRALNCRLSIAAKNKRLWDDDEDEYIQYRKKLHVPAAEGASFARRYSKLQPMHFLDLSDDIMLMILSYVDKESLVKLSRSCSRMRRICSDKTLWKMVKINCGPPLQACLPFLCEETTTLILVHTACDSFLDEWRRGNCLDEKMFSNLFKAVPKLERLVFIGHRFSDRTFQVIYLPRTLLELTIRWMTISYDQHNDLRVFKDLRIACPVLKALNVSYCGWFDSFQLLPLAKLQSLEELTLRNISRTDDFIPYASIASVIGFKTLQTLDLRRTALTDRELMCFNKLTTLRHVYLENPAPRGIREGLSDISLSTFGRHADSRNNNNNNANENVIYIFPVIAESNDVNTTIESFVIIGYPLVTHTTLNYFQKSLKGLKYLDMSGTGITTQQAREFKKARPEVKFICSNIVGDVPRILQSDDSHSDDSDDDEAF